MMNGFIQRLDEKFRVNGFSMLAVLGDEPNLEIQGVWMFRGNSIPQLNHPLFELSSKRLDMKSADDRRLVSEFWCAHPGVSTANGLKVLDCKLYK